ncbi:STAS domain-containing protein [Streptomyces zaomyceticus]|uniref:STAS domain-containing protein n=1 Tax=Streptomyces zaomyceticus TaxID=68286 RepID=UPI0036AB722C
MTHVEDGTVVPRPAGTPPTPAIPTPAVPTPAVVRVAGDLDMHHLEEVRSTLLRAIAEAPPGTEVLIDLMYSSFCDSSGLEALLTARQRALETGRTLRLGAPSHQMLRLMEITDTAWLFEMGPAPRDAPGSDGSAAGPDA